MKKKDKYIYIYIYIYITKTTNGRWSSSPNQPHLYQNTFHIPVHMQIQNTKYQHVSSFLIHINTQIKKSLNEKSQSHL